MSSKKIIEQITKKNNFLITTHVNSEGDALGSELALYRLIKALKKNVVMVNEDSLPYGYDFLPDAGKIIKYKTNLKGLEFDCLVTVDCSDLKRTGEVYKINAANKLVINIDHHISNAGFGDFNWIQPQASSCCEMIYELYKKLGVRLDKETALLLYVGISTDTGSFRYSNTTSHTHKIAAELLKHDIDVAKVYNYVHGNLPYQDMILVAKIINDVKCLYQGKIIWFQAKASLLKK
jgi:phosphoesterase RecJ-like protein